MVTVPKNPARFRVRRRRLHRPGQHSDLLLESKTVVQPTVTSYLSLFVRVDEQVIELRHGARVSDAFQFHLFSDRKIVQ